MEYKWARELALFCHRPLVWEYFFIIDVNWWFHDYCTEISFSKNCFLSNQFERLIVISLFQFFRDCLIHTVFKFVKLVWTYCFVKLFLKTIFNFTVFKSGNNRTCNPCFAFLRGQLESVLIQCRVITWTVIFVKKNCEIELSPTRYYWVRTNHQIGLGSAPPYYNPVVFFKTN
jgi:hypothetical protein